MAGWWLLEREDKTRAVYPEAQISINKGFDGLWLSKCDYGLIGEPRIEYLAYTETPCSVQEFLNGDNIDYIVIRMILINRKEDRDREEQKRMSEVLAKGAMPKGWKPKIE